MFSLFKKKRIELPEFEELKTSKIRDSYFIRRATWDWLDRETINVVDPNAPRVLTLDPWLQTIFLAANGQITITEFTNSMATKYGSKSSIPDGLDRTILGEIQKLVDLKIVELLDESQFLPYYIELPQSDQERDKAKRLMIADGFIKGTNT